MTDEFLTVFYDGACPLCRREIAHLQRLAAKRGGAGLVFVDLTATANESGLPQGVCRDTLMARFHVLQPDGTFLSGAAAFAAVWARLPGWRWLARVAALPGGLAALERLYRLFLRVRPRLQRWVSRWA